MIDKLQHVGKMFLIWFVDGYGFALFLSASMAFSDFNFSKISILLIMASLTIALFLRQLEDAKIARAVKAVLQVNGDLIKQNRKLLDLLKEVEKNG